MDRLLKVTFYLGILKIFHKYRLTSEQVLNCNDQVGWLKKKRRKKLSNSKGNNMKTFIIKYKPKHYTKFSYNKHSENQIFSMQMYTANNHMTGNSQVQYSVSITVEESKTISIHPHLVFLNTMIPICTTCSKQLISNNILI